MNEIIFSYGRFDVRVIDDHFEDGRQLQGYGVTNRDTGVVEMSTTLLFYAMQWCRNCEKGIEDFEDAVKNDNDDWKTAVALDIKPN